MVDHRTIPTIKDLVNQSYYICNLLYELDHRVNMYVPVNNVIKKLGYGLHVADKMPLDKASIKFLRTDKSFTKLFVNNNNLIDEETFDDELIKQFITDIVTRVSNLKDSIMFYIESKFLIVEKVVADFVSNSTLYLKLLRKDLSNVFCDKLHETIPKEHNQLCIDIITLYEATINNNCNPLAYTAHMHSNGCFEYDKLIKILGMITQYTQIFEIGESWSKKFSNLTSEFVNLRNYIRSKQLFIFTVIRLYTKLSGRLL